MQIPTKKKRQPLVDFCGQKRTIDPVHADSPTTKFKVSQRTEKKQKNLGIHYSLALSVALRLLYNLNQWTVVKATAGIKTNEKLDQSIDPRSVFFSQLQEVNSLKLVQDGGHFSSTFSFRSYR